MPITSRKSSERGAELVEFALVLPLLLAIVAGIIDFGLLFQRYLVLNNAAREGARLAVLPGYQAADVTFQVQRYLEAGLGDGTSTVTLEVVSLDPPGATPPFNAARVRVQVLHTYIILGPILQLLGGTGEGFGTITMTATSTMRYEVG